MTPPDRTQLENLAELIDNYEQPALFKLVNDQQLTLQLYKNQLTDTLEINTVVSLKSDPDAKGIIIRKQNEKLRINFFNRVSELSDCEKDLVKTSPKTIPLEWAKKNGLGHLRQVLS